MSLNDIGPIFCINLNTRKDRRDEMSNLFKDINIKVEFYTAERHPNGGEQGCFESHINVITEAYNRGYERCVILEDDLILSDAYSNESVKKCIDFTNKNNKWEIFYLGVLPNIATYDSTVVEDGIYKPKGIGTYAYVIHRRLMEKMIGMKYIGIHIDWLYIHGIKEAYAHYPAIFQQGISDSDIAKGSRVHKSLRTKDLINAFFKTQEMYAYHIGVPLVSTRTFIAALISLVYYFYSKNIIESILVFFLIMLLYGVINKSD